MAQKNAEDNKLIALLDEKIKQLELRARAQSLNIIFSPKNYKPSERES